MPAATTVSSRHPLQGFCFGRLMLLWFHSSVTVATAPIAGFDFDFLNRLATPPSLHRWLSVAVSSNLSNRRLLLRFPLQSRNFSVTPSLSPSTSPIGCFCCAHRLLLYCFAGFLACLYTVAAASIQSGSSKSATVELIQPKKERIDTTFLFQAM